MDLIPLLAAETPARQIGTGAEIKWLALGVAISFVMPVLLAVVKKYWPGTNITSWKGVWSFVAPYVVLAAFSLVVAFLLSAGANFETTELALLAGFAWDKTLQTAKIVWLE